MVAPPPHLAAVSNGFPLPLIVVGKRREGGACCGGKATLVIGKEGEGVPVPGGRLQSVQAEWEGGLE